MTALDKLRERLRSAEAKPTTTAPNGNVDPRANWTPDALDLRQACPFRSGCDQLAKPISTQRVGAGWKASHWRCDAHGVFYVNKDDTFTFDV